MANQVKNQFLILGLSGPLGSGCTTTAKFLSGFPSDSKIKIEDLLQIQADNLKNLNDKIRKEYEQIYSTKKKISDRLSKRLGPYKQNWIDPTKDTGIAEYEQKINRVSSKLKIYLKRREILKTLNKFLTSAMFENGNTNDLDKKAFGLSPFGYISFTTIIAKLAFERYVAKGGKRELDSYFSIKIKEAYHVDKSSAFKGLRRYVKRIFNVDESLKNAYNSSNKYMQNRVYQFALQYELSKDDKLKDHFNREMAKFFKSFYDFKITIDEKLEKIKNYAMKKGVFFSFALSEVLQDWGDNIRSSGNPFIQINDKSVAPYDNLFLLSYEINLLIKALRFRLRYLDSSFKYEGKQKTEPDCLFVIECFRNPYEIEFFRSRYSEFYLLSISTKKPIRKKRIGELFSQDRDVRDQGKDKNTDQLYKLDVRSCVLSSDIALLNDYDGKQQFFEKFLRYFALIRNPGCIPPNDNELYMHLAYSHSLKSTCISRKVGAVILGPKGYILGAGWNDAGDGQVGCGLRNKNDLLTIGCIPLASNESDSLKFKEVLSYIDGEYVCYKDIMSKIYTDKKIKNFSDNCPDDCLKKISSKLGIKRLEYCRALHAEENAILQSAKIGGMPIENGTIYTTTYPCELCAKKLYQIGIRTIYYTEPYPESISEQVFLEDGTKIIERIPFEGVKSHSYFKLFKPVYDKKELSKIEKYELSAKGKLNGVAS